ncbi:PIN domain-like protein, partial [Phyllosticta capitalensis]
MGIPGIYKEIGAGTRIALAKLAAQKFVQSGRPLRIAIDTAIWLVQIQSAKGGTNPALRTFYYRLLRLLSLSIDPLFVFDGPKKPKFKRNKQTGPNVATVPEFLAKQLLKQFGFPYHEAPGEAEAECALLQRTGIVDMVLSEDVDTLMFGSKMTIRNFSAEAKGKTATHVNLHDSEKTKAGPSGLDREGMILVAMMSGGDYAPEGIRDCGPKVACEAARAGYGKKLCEVMNDARKLEEWKTDLAEELRTNKSKFFRTKHPGIEIPDSWPRLEILKLYMHPATSSSGALDRLRGTLSWDGDIDLAGLRTFTSDAFKWQGKTGAKHFIRNMAQPMLVRKLRLRGKMAAAEMASQKTTDQLEEEESELVAKIHSRRAHVSTDQMEELRISIVPVKLVPIDLDAEEEDDENSVADLESEEVVAQDGEEGTAKRPSQYNPEELERHWVLDTLAAYGVPVKVEDWREAQRKKNAPKEPKAKKPRKETTKKPATKGGMPVGAL